MKRALIAPVILAIALGAGGVAGCETLLKPTGSGAKIADPASPDGERDETVADGLIGSAASVGRIFLPNPMLWSLLVQLGQAGVSGLVSRRRRDDEGEDPQPA